MPKDGCLAQDARRRLWCEHLGLPLDDVENLPDDNPVDNLPYRPFVGVDRSWWEEWKERADMNAKVYRSVYGPQGCPCDESDITVDWELNPRVEYHEEAKAQYEPYQGQGVKELLARVRGHVYRYPADFCANIDNLEHPQAALLRSAVGFDLWH